MTEKKRLEQLSRAINYALKRNNAIDVKQVEEFNSLIRAISYHPTREELLNDMHQVFLDKNQDYGNSFFKSCEEDGIVAAKTRIGDKLNRLENLTEGKGRVIGESAKDTIFDAANYALMTIIFLEDGMLEEEALFQKHKELCEKFYQEQPYEDIRISFANRDYYSLANGLICKYLSL